MHCANCQFDNPDAMRFCGGCGQPLGLRCSGCGADIPAGFKFCGQCGGAVFGAVAAASKTGERRQLTLMFCDLVASTLLAERLDPEDWHETVRGYQRITGEVVARFGGYVAQYLGDGVLVYFGYPRAHEDDATRAVGAGLEILEEIGRYSSRLSKSSEVLADTPMQVRIGVHTGTVVTGDVGHGERIDQLALGSAPNIAARVQAVAAPGELLITADTHALAARHIDCALIGERTLRNVAQPVTLYRAIRMRDEEALDQLHTTPFVGRERELQQLLTLQEQAQRGDAQAVLLVGEPGIGKSRLQTEVRLRLEGRIHRWYTCRCSVLHENSALYPILLLFKRMLDGEPDQATLRRWLDGLGVVGEDHANVLSVLLNVRGHAQVGDVPGTEASQRVIAVVTDVLLRLSAVDVVVIAFEDVHWADPSTLDVLGSLIRRGARNRMLLVIAARAPFVPPWEPTSNQTRIELIRFPTATSKQMVESWIADKLPAPLVEMLVARTDGVPLFLEELTRTLLRNDLTAGNVGALIPASLRDSLMARLDRLGPAKSTAQLGALLGRRFGFELLEHVSQLPTAVVEDHLSRIVDSGLLLRQGRGGSATFIFKHALVQETAYESLLHSQRRQLHNQVVQAVERNASIVELQPEVLARHLEGAERMMEAVEQYEAAGLRALKRWALVECIRLFRQALALLATQPRTQARDELELRLLGGLAEPVRAHLSYAAEELEEIFDREMELVHSMDDAHQFPALMNMWSIHCVKGNRSNAEATANELMRLAHTSGDKIPLAAAHFARGCTEVYEGLLQAGIDDLNQTIDLLDGKEAFGVRRSDPNQTAFLARLVKAWALTLTGRADTARDLLQGVLRVCESRGAPFPLVQTLCHVNVVDQDLDADPKHVLERGLRILRIAAEHSMPTWARFAHMHSGWARALMGDTDGVAELRNAVDSFGDAEGVTRGHTLLTLAQALQSLDRHVEAVAAIDEADAFFGSNLATFGKPESPRLRGLGLARAGDMDAARTLFQQSQRLAEQHGNKLIQLKALCDEIELLRDSTEVKHLNLTLSGLYQSIGEGRDTRPLLRAVHLLETRRRESA